MRLPQVNYLAVVVSGVATFVLGGLWYSPALFAKKWMALTGKSEADLKAGASGAMPIRFLLAFVCGTLSAWVLAVVLNHFVEPTPLRGALVGALCWLGFAGATSYANALFSGKPKALWLIDSGSTSFRLSWRASSSRCGDEDCNPTSELASDRLVSRVTNSGRPELFEGRIKRVRSCVDRLSTNGCEYSRTSDPGQ